MKIFEVLGNIGGVAGLKYMAQAGLTSIKDTLTGLNTKSWKDTQSATAQQTVITQLTQQLIRAWPQIVLQTMAKSQDPATGAKGVTNFRLINRRDLALELNKSISALVQLLTNNRYKNINDFISVSKSDLNVEQRQAIDDAQRKINSSMRLILGTDPNSTRATTVLPPAWGGLIKAIMDADKTLSSPDTLGLAGMKIAKDRTGKITLNGKVLDPTNANDAAILANIQAQGLMP